MKLEVTWTVSGTSEMDLSDDEVRQAMRDGVDPEDFDALYAYVARKWPAQYEDLADEWTERDEPTVVGVMGFGSYPEVTS